jgi:hypothetical protein
LGEILSHTLFGRAFFVLIFGLQGLGGCELKLKKGAYGGQDSKNSAFASYIYKAEKNRIYMSRGMNK